MKNKLYAMAAGLVLVSLAFPSYVQASDGEEYITISVDAVDDNANLQYALDSDAPSAFTESNEFTVPAGTSHTIYVKDAAGNVTSQRYGPEAADEERTDYDDELPDFYEDEEEQRINIDLELGRKEEGEEEETAEEGNAGTASVLSRTKTDGTVDAEKVFYTFTTKEGAELYLVIDQGRGTDNVYLLDTVSLGDLRVLADSSAVSATEAGDKNEDNLLSILASENETAEDPDELQPEKKKKSALGNNLVILLFAGIGGGIYYYMKVYRNKRDEAMDAIDAMDMDEFEPEEDEDEELDFGYDDAEKEEFLEALINGEEEEEGFFDQDPGEYAASHTDEELNVDDVDEDDYDGMEINF